jgi:tetratricopeptide (TPR) repeat protein
MQAVADSVAAYAKWRMFMNIWKLLGISETKDKDELKKAYRAKLTAVNPEDDAEGFMALRRAYEEALRLADSEGDETPEDDACENNLLGKISSLYRNYDRRIDKNAWEELFDSDEFVSLETSEESFDTLIKFLMDNYHIPSDIYKLIVEVFDVEYRKKELAEKYPLDFIEYMINNATYDDLIDYYMFEGDAEQFDKYIDLYYRLDLAHRKGESEKERELLDELTNLDVTHPYLEIVRIRYRLQDIIDSVTIGDDETDSPLIMDARRELTETERMDIYMLKGDAELLRQDFPRDITILNCIGDLDLVLGDYDEAELVFKEGLEYEEDSYVLKGKMAELFLCRGEYVKSRDAYMELLRKNHYDNKVRAGMIRANQGIIAQNREKLNENPDDNRARLEIAWSCYQSYRFDEGIEILDTFEPDGEEIFEYYNVKGRTYLCKLDYEAALPCFFSWKEAIESLDENAEEESDTSLEEKVREKKKRYPYVNFLIADCYLKLKNYKEAEKYLAIPLAEEHEEKVLSLESNCELQYEKGDYEKCLDACDKLLDCENRNYMAYLYRAKANLSLNYLNDSMQACERAINVYPYTVDPYVIEIKLYHKVKQYDDALAIVERYRSIIPESDSMTFYEALTYRYQEQDGKAAELLEQLRENVDADKTDLEDVGEVLSLLGDIYDKQGRNDEAISCYKELIEKDDNHRTAHGDLGYMYKKTRDYKSALYEFNRQIEIEPHPVYYINKGILEKWFENYKSALEAFQEALKMDPKNAFCHSRVGIIYQMHRNFQEAYECFQRSIAFMSQDESEFYSEVAAWKAKSLACMFRYNEAVDTLKDAWEKHSDVDVFYDMIEILVRAGRFREAETLVEKFTSEQQDKSAKAYILKLMIQLYGEEGYVDRAFETYKLVLSMDDTDCRTYAYMARIYAQNGRYAEAKELFNRAVELDRENEENYYSELIEVIHKKAGLVKPRCENLVKKATIDKKNLKTPREYVKMARLCRVLRQYDKALEYVNKAISMRRCDNCAYCGCFEAYYEKGLIYEALNQLEIAKSCYEKLLTMTGHCGLYERRLKEVSDRLEESGRKRKRK